MDYIWGKCVFVFLCDPVNNLQLVKEVTALLPGDSEAPSSFCFLHTSHSVLAQILQLKNVNTWHLVYVAVFQSCVNGGGQL